MKKSKLTARHLTIYYPTTTGTTRGSDAATKQYLLLNRPSSRRLILLTRNFIQNVFCAPKGKHSSFQCIILRKALGAPPPSANKDSKNQHEQNLFLTIKEEGASRMGPTTSGLTPGLTPNKG